MIKCTCKNVHLLGKEKVQTGVLKKRFIKTLQIKTDKAVLKCPLIEAKLSDTLLKLIYYRNLDACLLKWKHV